MDGTTAMDRAHEARDGDARFAEDRIAEGMPPLTAAAVAATDWDEFKGECALLPPRLARPALRDACRVRLGLEIVDCLRDDAPPERIVERLMDRIVELRLEGVSNEALSAVAEMAVRMTEGVASGRVAEVMAVLGETGRFVDAKMAKIGRRPASAPAPRARRPVVARRPARRRPERRSSRQAGRRSAGTRRASSTAGRDDGGGGEPPGPPPPAQPRRRGDEHDRGRDLDVDGEHLAGAIGGARRPPRFYESTPPPGTRLDFLNPPWRRIKDVPHAAVVLLAVRERLVGGAA